MHVRKTDEYLPAKLIMVLFFFNQEAAHNNDQNNHMIMGNIFKWNLQKRFAQTYKWGLICDMKSKWICTFITLDEKAAYEKLIS